jgi:hypothetical protein
MRRAICIPCVICLCLARTETLRSAEAPSPRQLITKGIEAQGGAEALRKFKAVTFKDKGTFHGKGEGQPYTGAYAIQGDKQFRMALDTKENGKDVTRLFVVNGARGWVRVSVDGKGETQPMGKEHLAEQQEAMYAGWVATLLPLKDEAFKLSSLGEARVGGKPALGVGVEHKGHRPVSLYFDKATGLLVKSVVPVKNFSGGASKDVLQETFYKDYKTFDGAKQATRLTIHSDGKPYVESEVTEFRPTASLDVSLFAEPK